MHKKYYWANLASYGFLVISAVAFTYAVGYLNGVKTSRQTRDFPVLHEAYALLQQYHLNGLPGGSTLDYGALRGVLATLKDPYSVFLEPPSQELETQTLQGEFGGIGVNIRRNDSGDVALSPFPDYPAIQAGIVDGDVLVAVDDKPITIELTLEQVSALVRGLVDTPVRITFRRGTAAAQSVTLTRVKVEIPSVTGRILDQDPTLGLVALSRFSDKTPTETQALIDQLQAQGAQGIVLDLRGNGGGLLDSGIDTASLFLDSGVIMYEVQQGQAEKIYATSTQGTEAAVPLVLIVNRGTASAAEILAGALRDRGRAPLIGQTTYGKGSVQLIFKLSDQSSIHITNARWFTPNRTELDGVGLKPDFEIEPGGAGGGDPELDRAIEYLQTVTP